VKEIATIGDWSSSLALGIGLLSMPTPGIGGNPDLRGGGVGKFSRCIGSWSVCAGRRSMGTL